MFWLFLWIIYIQGVLEQFGTENYTWRLDIVQNLSELWQFFLCDFLGLKCDCDFELLPYYETLWQQVWQKVISMLGTHLESLTYEQGQCNHF